MPFANDKRNALLKLHVLDKSKKGSLDEEIAELVNLINSLDNYYTTSSCAGRIMLIKEGKSNSKFDTTWIFASHKYIGIDDFKENLANLPEENVWFRMEPPILHICAKDLADAKNLLQLANSAGFRRAGAITLGRRIILEIVAPGTLDLLLSTNKELLLSEDYIKTIIVEANKKLKVSRGRLDRLFVELKKME